MSDQLSLEFEDSLLRIIQSSMPSAKQRIAATGLFKHQSPIEALTASKHLFGKNSGP